MPNRPKLILSISDGFLESTIRMHPADARRVAAFLDKLVHAPDGSGLNAEPIHEARDRSLRSFRVSRDLRAIGIVQGARVEMFYVDQHDEAYRWAREHCVECGDEPQIQVVEDRARRICDSGELCQALDEAGIDHGLTR